MARVLRLSGHETVGGRAYDGVLVTEEWKLEPDVVERKYYARGTGLLFEEQVRGGSSKVALVSFTGGNNAFSRRSGNVFDDDRRFDEEERQEGQDDEME